MVGWFIRGGKKVAETITKVKPGTKFTGQKTKESIIEAGKKFKSKLADEAKKKKKKKSWKNYVDTSHPSYKKNWPPGE